MPTAYCTITVVDCANSGIHIAGVEIIDNNSSSPTYGELIATTNGSGVAQVIWDTDVWGQTYEYVELNGLNVGYDTAPYVTATALGAGDTGSIQPCLGKEGSGGGTGGGTGSCLVATAAYGSPGAPEITRLAGLRNRTVETTEWGSVFFERLSGEYYTYSPRISDDMWKSQELRDLILKGMVEPYVEFLGTARLVFEGADDEQLHVHLSAIPTDECVSEAHQMAVLLRSTLSAIQSGGQVDSQPDDAPNDAVGAARYVVGVATSSSPSLAISSWALLEPITLRWEAFDSATITDGPVVWNLDAVRGYRSAILSWAGRVPSRHLGLSASVDAHQLFEAFAGLSAHH